MIRSLLCLLLRRIIGLVRSNDRIAAEAELEIAVLRHEVWMIANSSETGTHPTL